MNVSIPEPMRDWVQQRIESGQYASVSDYVRDLIRQDQAMTEERKILVTALLEGEQSGISERRVPAIFADIKRDFSGEQDE